jgi:hypothetical protein
MQQSLFEPLDSARVFASQPQLKSSVFVSGITRMHRASSTSEIASVKLLTATHQY